MECIGIIPARYSSTRFPGKPLAMIGGKSMIRRVYEQASLSSSLSQVVVATDDHRIFDHVADFGHVVMTGMHHQSGTDRCHEALVKLNQDGKYKPTDCVINIQGDEPFINPLQIDNIASILTNHDHQIASLYKRLENQVDLDNPNVVKVVFDNTGRALYFSRSPIPFCRGKQPEETPTQWLHFKHLGLYGYRINILEELVSLPLGRLERAESLEQLRWLEHGFQIHLNETQHEGIAIDTPDDLKKIPPMNLSS